MPTKKVAIDERYAYLQVQYERYQLADRRTKGGLLTEMIAVTGMHIKSLTRLMNGPPPCRERLQPMLPSQVDHVCALGLAHCDRPTRQQLESISVSTVGRVLRRIRQDEPRLRQCAVARQCLPAER